MLFPADSSEWGRYYPHAQPLEIQYEIRVSYIASKNLRIRAEFLEVSYF